MFFTFPVSWSWSRVVIIASLIWDPHPDLATYGWSVSDPLILMRTRIRILLVTLMRIRILPYLPVRCAIRSWSIFRSKLLIKGSKPWKSPQIGSYSINFGLSSANWCGSGSGLSLGCGSDAKSSLHNLLRFTTCIGGLMFESVCGGGGGYCCNPFLSDPT